MSKFKVGDIVRIIGAEDTLIVIYPCVLVTKSALGDMIVTRIIEEIEESPFACDKGKKLNRVMVDIERCDGHNFIKFIPNSNETLDSRSITLDEADLELIEDRRM